MLVISHCRKVSSLIFSMIGIIFNSYLLIIEIKYCQTLGVIMRSAKIENDNVVAQLPITMMPSPFPARLYQTCLDIHPTMSKLMFKLATNLPYMEDSLNDIIQVDDFTKNLLHVQQCVEREGQAQTIMSCINRSDYLLDRIKSYETNDNCLGIRQVEINAIASSMSPHSCKVHNLHKFLTSKYKLPLYEGLQKPENNSLEFIATELTNLYDMYNKKDCFILLVNEPRSVNFGEHFSIEYEVHTKRPDVKFLRRSFKDLPGTIKLGPNKELIMDDRYEIALVYFRYGYDPTNYNFDEAWDIRLMLERSKAIKCPSIAYHVSGIKKFQQLLCNQEKLELFLDSSEAIEMTKVMCKFWPVDAGTSEGQEGYKLGLNEFQNLVLKPQREGGGHNLYGLDVKKYLESIVDSEERQQYILMQKIDAPSERNWLLHPDDKQNEDLSRLNVPQQLISELGIYGSIVSDEKSILSNKSAGYLVRTKKSGVNEGGVIAGYSGISSIVLFDDTVGDLEKFYQL